MGWPCWIISNLRVSGFSAHMVPRGTTPPPPDAVSPLQSLCKEFRDRMAAVQRCTRYDRVTGQAVGLGSVTFLHNHYRVPHVAVHKVHTEVGAGHTEIILPYLSYLWEDLSVRITISGPVVIYLAMSEAKYTLHYLTFKTFPYPPTNSILL